MCLFRKLFPSGQQRGDAEQAREIIERALRESRQPKGCRRIYSAIVIRADICL
jgi:hypothetical protein